MGVVFLLGLFLVLSRVPLRVQIRGGQLEIVRVIEMTATLEAVATTEGATTTNRPMATTTLTDWPMATATPPVAATSEQVATPTPVHTPTEPVVSGHSLAKLVEMTCERRRELAVTGAFGLCDRGAGEGETRDERRGEE